LSLTLLGDAPDSKKRDGELSRLEACRGVGRDARTETETDGPAMRAMRISKIQKIEWLI
jgi:hypothetical protein